MMFFDYVLEEPDKKGMCQMLWIVSAKYDFFKFFLYLSSVFLIRIRMDPGFLPIRRRNLPVAGAGNFKNERLRQRPAVLKKKPTGKYIFKLLLIYYVVWPTF